MLARRVDGRCSRRDRRTLVAEPIPRNRARAIEQRSLRVIGSQGGATMVIEEPDRGSKASPQPAGRRARIAENALDLVGRTPLVRINRLTEGCAAEVVGKLEFYAPGASVKD